MSAFKISLIVFFAAIGLLFILGLGRVTEIIVGVSALVCAGTLLFGDSTARTL